jgi:hypothetical protein
MCLLGTDGDGDGDGDDEDGEVILETSRGGP